MAGKRKRGVFNEVSLRLDNFGKNVSIMQADLVHECAELVLEKAKEFAPEDTGALRASGAVESDVKRHGFLNRATAEVRFGGLTPVVGRNSPDGVVRYAGAVHETQTPFLRNAYTAVAEEMRKKIKLKYSGTKLKRAFLRSGSKSR